MSSVRGPGMLVAGVAMMFYALQAMTVTAVGALTASYNAATDVPVTASSYTAADTVTFTLNCAPTTGATLTVVNNTGPGFINGTFGNLAQGQVVALSHNGVTYHFVANYYGGTGNDLVLQWADVRPVAWGEGYYGQLGNNHTTDSHAAVDVDMSGVLSGRTVIALAAGYDHSLALCSDGTLAAWGSNSIGQLGNNSTTSSPVPVAVSAAGVLAGKTVVAMATGNYHSLALCSDGTLAAWGYNSSGQLGSNITDYSTVPVAVNTAGVLSGKTVTAVSAGATHSLVLCSDGTLAAWGSNVYGQLGNDSTTNSFVPVTVNTSGVLSGKTVIALAAGENHCLALCSDGTLAAWGSNNDGQLGNNSTADSHVPVAVDATGVLSGKAVIAMSAGSLHNLALCSDGTLVAWGYNLFGQLGNNNTINCLVPVAVSTSSFATGERFALGTSSPSAIHCLGLVAQPASPRIVLEQPSGTALISDSSTVTFGSSPVGQGTQEIFTIKNIGTNPLTISSITIDGTNGAEFALTTSPAASVAAGASTTLTVTFTATAALGGRSASLHLASNDPDTGLFNVNLTGVATLAAVYTTGLEVPLTSNSPTTTGSTVNFTLSYAPAVGTTLMVVNNTGLGFINGTFGNLAQGQAVALSYNGITYNFVANYYGGTGNDLVLQWANVRPVAWGYNADGELGNNSTTNSPVPVGVNTAGVLSGKTVIAAAAGLSHSLALCSDGTVAAWGYNGFGQLGNSSTTDSSIPVAVNTSGALSGKTVIAVAAGCFHSLALCSDGTLAAWGDNTFGELGNYTSKSSVPVAVTTAGTPIAGKTVIAVAAGYLHSLALCSDGTLAAWGNNDHGQLGNNNSNTTNSPVPVAVTTAGTPIAGKTVIAVAAGASHNLALCSDGTLAAWGENTHGQLGNINNGQNNAYVLIAVDTTTAYGSALYGKTVVATAAGADHSLALCSDGTLLAWGRSDSGQLGNGTNGMNNAYVPVAVDAAGVLAGKMVIAVAGGGSYSLAQCSDGTLAAWGFNADGELGDNSTTNRSVPVLVNTASLAPGEGFMAGTSGQTAEHSLGLVAMPPPPAVTTLAATLVTTTSATLNGIVNANGYSRSVSFDYGASASYGTHVEASPTPVTGISDTAVSASLTGLTPGTIYHYRVNGSYTSKGDDLTFTTLSNNANLSNLTLSSGTLAPSFSSGTSGYTASVPSAAGFITLIYLTPTVADATATVKVNGTAVASGMAIGPITLNVGGTVISILVTAQDGITSQTYTVIANGPLIVVQQSSTALTSGVSSSDFGGAVPGKTVARVFTVKNVGKAMLSGFGLSVDGANPGDFTVTTPPAASVAIGGSTTFTVTFKPGAIGARSATLHIACNDVINSPFDIAMTGTGAALPAIDTPPVSQIIPVGQPVTLTVIAHGGALSYQWLKNNAAISGATSSTYNVAAVTTGNGGSYTVKVTNAAGSATSVSASLGVVNVAPASVSVALGNTLTLTASTAGPNLAYQWWKNGSNMANGANPATNSLGTISGVTTSKLAITNAVTADADSYTCSVTMPDPQNLSAPLSLTSGVFTVNVLKPVLDAFNPGPWIVSGTVTDRVTAQNFPTTFTVTGLPAGVTVSTQTGQLSGKPTVPLVTTTLYRLTVTASNAAGASAPLTVYVTVHPLQSNVIGTFNGLVDRDATLSSAYGGMLNVASLSNGTFTGKLTLGGLPGYSFTSQRLNATVGAASSATVVIPRKLPLHNLTLSLGINQATGELTGSVTDGFIATPVNVHAWRNPWNATNYKAPLAATYTSELLLDPTQTGTGSNASNVAFPQGTGYGTLAITTAGAATWSGKMADGAVATGSTTMGPNGEVPLHFMLNNGTGSAHGWVTASADTTVPQANNGLRLIDGSVDWFKSKAATTTADRIYNAGIPINTLTVIGGEYVKPTSTVLGITDHGSNDATIAFSEGGLIGPAPLVAAVMAADPNKPFRITTTNTLAMPTAANNPAALSLALNAGTGGFSGTFVLKDPDPTDHLPPTTVLSRTVYYYGLLVPRLSVNQGVGYFLLPELPADATAHTPKTTLSTSPILSGKVLIGPL